MYELKAGSKSARRLGNTKRNNMPSQMLRQGDRFADRNIKLGYCPAGKEGSVVQMMEPCPDYGGKKQYKYEKCEWDDPCDKTYKPCGSEQYLDPKALRKKLGAEKIPGGEAHHIIPGNVVKEMKPEEFGKSKDDFNQAWNGIMMNGAKVAAGIVNEFVGKAPKPCHREGNKPNHKKYDKKVIAYIENNKKTMAINDIASYIREKIKKSEEDCLDNMPLE